MDLLWIASLKLIIFTDIRTIKGLKTKMSGFDVFSNMKKLSCLRLREYFRGQIYFRRRSVPVAHD